MSWDADLTDVDLHVFEPTGDHGYYGNSLTSIGGLVSRDFTQGYGPEEYVLRRAAPGEYVIKAHYYSSWQQTVSGPCTVVVSVFTHYGRPSEEKQVLTLRLDRPREQVRVGEVTFAGSRPDTAPGDPSVTWEAAFRGLERGMNVDEVVGRVGQPDEIRGSDAVLMIYRPAADVVVHVRVHPGGVAVERVLDGAVLDLLGEGS